MGWEKKFWKPIKLKDGRKIDTLGEARDLILTLPQFRQRNPDWRLASELLARASESISAVDDALTQLLRALKAALAPVDMGVAQRGASCAISPLVAATAAMKPPVLNAFMTKNTATPRVGAIAS